MQQRKCCCVMCCSHWPIGQPINRIDKSADKKDRPTCRPDKNFVGRLSAKHVFMSADTNFFVVRK